MSRRASETYERIAPVAPKPQNFNIVFNQPNFARELFDKMQKNRTYVFGLSIETKRFWILSGLLLLFALSFSGLICMWFTSTFDNMVFANMALQKDKESFELWSKPSPKPQYKVNIFNYTNVQDFESGYDKKLKVKELGPYVYEMSLERVNTKFINDKITYQEQKSFKFMPEISKGRQSDTVVVPNIPLLSAVSINKEANFLVKVGLSTVLAGLKERAFKTLAADRFIVGYDDRFYTLAKSYLKMQNQRPFDRFGLISNSIGLRADVQTVNTGINDINKLGLISSINGESSLKQWSTKECNAFNDATDGTFFSPKAVRNKKPVKFFIPEMCRALPLEFKKEIKILNGEIPAYRYTMPFNVYDSADRTPANQCFCNMDLGKCLPQGIFNATPCFFGAPLFYSLPHFYNADPIFSENVLGLNTSTNLEDYESYVDIHPTLGFVMAGKTRIQVNVKVSKVQSINQVRIFEDGLMLPVAIIEYSLEDKTLPEDVVGIIFLSTFTLSSIEIGLKYVFLLTTLVTMIGIILVLRNKWTERKRIAAIRPWEQNSL